MVSASKWDVLLAEIRVVGMVMVRWVRRVDHIEVSTQGAPELARQEKDRSRGCGISTLATVGIRPELGVVGGSKLGLTDCERAVHEREDRAFGHHPDLVDGG
jgi:hypothetical protein